MPEVGGEVNIGEPIIESESLPYAQDEKNLWGWLFLVEQAADFLSQCVQQKRFLEDGS
jgi:hypothetical protein